MCTTEYKICMWAAYETYVIADLTIELGSSNLNVVIINVNKSDITSLDNWTYRAVVGEGVEKNCNYFWKCSNALIKDNGTQKKIMKM